MEVRERVKYVRKEKLNLTQEAFGTPLNLSRGNIANIEVGRVKLTERNLLDMCSIYNINEEWLRTGNGGDESIFLQPAVSEKAYNRFGYIMENASSSKKAVLSMLLEILYKVPDNQWEDIMAKFEDIKENLKREG